MHPDPSASAPQGPRLVRFTEPSEGAFTLVLPDDWQVQGGVVRGAADPRPWYRVVSPGGGAELRGSDPRVPPSFVAPGFGMMPLPGVPVRPYVPAVAFAEEYARHFAREAGAAAFEPAGVRDVEAILADDPRPETRPRVAWMMQQGAELGGVTFVCPDRGLSGLVDVISLRMQGPFGLTWSPFVTALIGPTQAWADVKATLLRIAHSYQTNPAWQQAQQQMQQAQHQMTMDTINTGTRILQMQHQSGMEAIRAAGQRAQMSAQTSAEISDMQMQAWRQQQASSDEMQRRTVNAINERVDLYDPASGQVYRGAPAGYRTYWTDGADRVVASEGYDNPDPTRLTQATDLDDLHGA
jgi:hypothetical protein